MDGPLSTKIIIVLIADEIIQDTVDLVGVKSILNKLGMHRSGKKRIPREEGP